MAKTFSTMLDLGIKAPKFALPDAAGGGTVSLDDFNAKKGLLIMFICNHCPYVIHVQHELVAIACDYQKTGFGVVAISSNDRVAYPDDSPEKMKAYSAECGFTFPYLFDESQQVAKAYRAACTPDLFLFNSDQQLVYRGQLDDSRPSNDLPVTGASLRAAMDSVAGGMPVPEHQKPSIGCNIKWKEGNSPDYYR